MAQVFLEPVFQKKTRYAKRKIASYVFDIVEDLASGKINQSYEKNFVPLSLSELPRVVSNFKTSNQEENMLIKVIRNAVIGSENSHATSSIFFSILLHKILVEIEKNKDNQDRISEDYEAIMHKASRYRVPSTMKDIREYWDLILKDDVCSYILEKSITLAGPSGNIYIDKGKSIDTSMELVCGYPYMLSAPDEFIIMTKAKKITFNECKVLLIDGLIEKESEIHAVLKSFHENMQPGIIFARGFKEEVIATLATNWNRGTLKVLPVLVPYDLEGVNLLKDIAVITGNDVVSSLKGELISSIDFDEINEVPKLSYHEGNILIENNSTHHDVRKHITNLKLAILENPQEEKRRMISRRIKGLLSRCVYIRIDDSLFEKKPIYVDRLETGIRAYRDISRYGLVDLRKIKFTKESAISDAINLMISYGFTKISFIAFCEALKRTISISRVLGNCNTMVLCKN